MSEDLRFCFFFPKRNKIIKNLKKNNKDGRSEGHPDDDLHRLAMIFGKSE